jgi:hypothetical protein
MPDRDKLSWAKGLKGFLRRSRSQPPVADPPTNTTSVRQSTVTAPLADAQQTAHATPHSTATKHTNEHTEKYGLFPLQPTIIASGDDEDGMTNLIDIVAVHGITGDALNTWTHNNGNLWLRDLIPEAFPGVRVFSYGYPADVFCTFNVGTLDTYARSLLEGLKRERRNKKVGIIYNLRRNYLIEQCVIRRLNFITTLHRSYYTYLLYIKVTNTTIESNSSNHIHIS